MPLDCQIITGENDILRLAPQWRLLQSQIGKSPFTSFEAAWTWWLNWGKPIGLTINLCAGFRDGVLVGVLPFCLEKNKGIRVLRLLANDVFYYYPFLIATPDDVAPMWETALRTIDYDVASIKNIHSKTPEEAYFLSQTRPIRTSPAYYCKHTKETQEQSLSLLSRSTRKKMNQNLQEFSQERGGFFCTASSKDVPDHVLSFLLAQKKRWAETHHQKGPLDEGCMPTFLKELNAAMPCRWFWLEKDKHLAAALWAIEEKDHLYAYVITYDPLFGKISPGKTLLFQTLLWAAAHGYTETNFMDGHDSYKSSLTKTARDSSEYIIARTFYGTLYATTYKLKLWVEAKWGKQRPQHIHQKSDN